MSEVEAQRRKSFLTPAVGAVIVYFLSSGPAVWLASRDMLDIEHLETIYAPIVWAVHHSETCEKVVEFWVELWWAHP